MLTIRYTRRYILSLLLATMTIVAWANSGRLFTSDRLTSNTVNNVCQDKYGFIWIGTENGLSKYDGYNFVNYMTVDGDTTSLISNEISAFLTDRKGNLWIGCSHGLVNYDYATDKFHRYNFPKGWMPRVESIIETSAGDIIVGTSGYGLFSLEKGTNRMKELPEYKRNPIDDFASRMFVDNEGWLWRSSHLAGITRIKVKDGKPVSFRDFKLSKGPAITYLRTNKQSLLLVCMYGLLSYDYKTGKISDAGYDMSALSSKVSIRHAMIDHQGNIYLGTSGSGLMVIPRGSKTLRQFVDQNRDFSLASTNINDIIEDKDHNLWICCYKKGIYQLSQQKNAFKSTTFKSQNILLGSSVSSIALGNDGDVWMTVQKSGIYRADKWGNITANPTVPGGSDLIYRDKQGNYWLCTENTLYAYDPYSNRAEQRLQFDGWGVGCIADNGQGTLYISTLGKGLTIFDTQSGTAHTISMNNDRRGLGTVCNDWIKSLFVDRRGYLWIGTSNGVSCMNTRTESFKDFGWRLQLPNLQGLSIGENRQGDILIGTDNGLYTYSRQGKNAETFANSERLKGKSIYSIVIDNDGQLWFSTPKGIWYYDEYAKQFISHASGNGLVNKENVLGAVRKADGEIVMANYDGLTAFYPQEVRKLKNIVGDVRLTSFVVNGRSLDFRNSQFELSHDENSFTLHFSQMNFKDPEETTFQYRINGNSTWEDLPDGGNTLSLNKLNSGNYTIEVRAVNNGICSLHPLKIKVTVDAPWYASTIAYVLYFVAVITLIALGVTFYVRRRKAEMEEAKMQFLINATHDIRSPLTLIMGPLAKLKQRLTDEENQADIDTIDRNAQRLLLLVNQILDKRKIDKQQMHLHCKRLDLVKLIEGTCSMFQFNADQRDIAFSFNHEDESVEAWVDKINFDKVVSNLLSNAFKFVSDGGEITVELSQSDKTITIKVIDNGVGFGDAPTARLFERFQQGNNVNIGGTGIGLNLCRAIVKMHGGQIKAYNRTDGERGACIEVVLKKGKDHLKPEEVADVDITEESHKARKNQPKKNIKIAVVDDNEEITQYITNELAEWYRFDSFHNGEEALRALLVGNYDLVISDVMMPVMDGISLLKNIKRNINISHIPVILLTSKDDIADKLVGLKLGADAYIGKPFDMELLHVTIDNLTDNVRRLKGKFSGAQKQEDKVEKIEVKGNDDKLMERVMDTINKHITEPEFNVEVLAQNVGVSRVQLHRKMKEMTGITPSDFIRSQRLEQAARLLREHKVNVTQVAYAVGFTNQAHFSTIFKKQFGLSPTEYSEKIDQEEQQ